MLGTIVSKPPQAKFLVWFTNYAQKPRIYFCQSCDVKFPNHYTCKNLWNQSFYVKPLLLCSSKNIYFSHYKKFLILLFLCILSVLFGKLLRSWAYLECWSLHPIWARNLWVTKYNIGFPLIVSFLRILIFEVLPKGGGGTFDFL